MVYEMSLQDLAAVADELRDDGRWPRYLAYLDSRLRGPKFPHHEPLEAFIQEARLWESAQRRQWAGWLVELLASSERLTRWHYCGRQDPRLLPLKLEQEVFVPALLEWRRDEPEALTPALGLGVYASSAALPGEEADAHLRDAALHTHATDLPRIVLARRRLALARFAFRRLPGEVLEPVAMLDAALHEAREMIDKIDSESVRRKMAEEAALFAAILADWSVFVESGDADFPGWCRAQGRDYPWSVIGYRRA